MPLGKKQTRIQPYSFTAEDRRALADLYGALLGVVSEYGEGFFNSYHKRGTRGLLNELESILVRVAPDELAAMPDS